MHRSPHGLPLPALAGKLREPPEPGLGAGLRLVLGADPAGVADAVEVLVEEGIVDLARPRLVAAGIVRELDMRDAAEVGLDGAGEIPLHDLHVVDVVLQKRLSEPTRVDDRQRLPRRVQEEAGNVAGVDRLDQQLDAGVLRARGAAKLRFSTKTFSSSRRSTPCRRDAGEAVDLRAAERRGIVDRRVDAVAELVDAVGQARRCRARPPPSRRPAG